MLCYIHAAGTAFRGTYTTLACTEWELTKAIKRSMATADSCKPENGSVNRNDVPVQNPKALIRKNSAAAFGCNALSNYQIIKLSNYQIIKLSN